MVNTSHWWTTLLTCLILHHRSTLFSLSGGLGQMRSNYGHNLIKIDLLLQAELNNITYFLTWYGNRNIHFPILVYKTVIAMGNLMIFNYNFPSSKSHDRDKMSPWWSPSGSPTPRTPGPWLVSLPHTPLVILPGLSDCTNMKWQNKIATVKIFWPKPILGPV